MRAIVVAMLAVGLYLVLKTWVGSMTQGIEAFLLYVVPFAVLLRIVGTSAKRLDDRSSQITRNERFRRRCGDDDGLTPQERAERLFEFEGVLFLRPFAVDTQFRVRNARKDGFLTFVIPFYGMLLPDSSSLDDAFRLQCRSTGELLAIGDDDANTIGATRVESSDARWRADFRVLALAARRIIVVPSRQDGIAWEIGEIVADARLLTKSVFMLTPERHDDRMGFAALADVIVSLRAAGLRIPDDAKHGEGLVFDADREIRWRKPVILAGIQETRVAARALRQCLAAAQPVAGPSRRGVAQMR